MTYTHISVPLFQKLLNYKENSFIYIYIITVTVQRTGAENCPQVCTAISPATLNQNCLWRATGQQVLLQTCTFLRWWFVGCSLWGRTGRARRGGRFRLSFFLRLHSLNRHFWLFLYLH